MTMFKQPHKIIHIGVIAPYLQGDYMGEIINHIRYICENQNYRFTAIRTDGFGQYSLGIGLDMLDGVIVLRNAASPKLIEKIQNRRIPVVAIAHDYFPLDVPVVTSNNSHGAELAFEYLTERGHTDLLFVGDITQYDLRKRYERFTELEKSHGLPHGNQQLICAANSIFTGGLAAGKEFLQRGSQCTGIFCGAGHTAMGFIKELTEFGAYEDSAIDVVCYDSIKMMHHLTPNLAYIDQNLDVIAQRAVATLNSMIHSSVLPTRAITVSPTLCNYKEDVGSNTCFSVDTLDNADYDSSLLNNSFEITRDIVNSRLDKLMSIAPLFNQFMHFGVLSCIVYDRHGRQFLHTHKIFKAAETIVVSGSDKSYISPPEDFPPAAVRNEYNPEKADSWVHFPVMMDKNLWGILSIAGASDESQNPGNFTSFTGFLDNISFAYSMVLENSSLREELKHSVAEPPQTNRQPAPTNLPSFDWDLEKSALVWSNTALELLGFTTELEKNIYRSMEIFDRIHPEDESKLREILSQSFTKRAGMTTAVRLKTAEGEYRFYSIQGEVSREENDKVISYRCCLSLIN